MWCCSATSPSFPRVLKGKLGTGLDVPGNLLIAMGLSITAAAGAKAITVSYLSSGRLSKPPSATGKPRDLLLDDNGMVDLTKVQMLAWTGVAIGVYFITLVRAINAFPAGAQPPTLLELPDIDPALMVLMGLGQGAYIGRKLVTATTPRLSGVVPTQGRCPSRSP